MAPQLVWFNRAGLASMLHNTFPRKTTFSSFTVAAASIRLKSHRASRNSKNIIQIYPPPIKSTSAPPDSPARKPSLVTVRDVPAPHTGVIRTLLLNNPRSRNAISRQMLKELAHEIHAVEAEEQGRRNGTLGDRWGVRALIIDSACDQAFCAGADLKERRAMSKEETSQFLNSLRSTFAALDNLPIPTISAVSSVAYGGGLELALSTTFRVFASTAIIALPEVSLGIIPGAGGTYRLARLVGQGCAMAMVLSGEKVNVESSAFRIGLCDNVVDMQNYKVIEGEDWYGENGLPGGKLSLLPLARAKTSEAAMEFAKLVCKGAPLATVAAIRAVRGSSPEAENAAYNSIIGTEDRDEALTAFAEKRQPVFKGQ